MDKEFIKICALQNRLDSFDGHALSEFDGPHTAQLAGLVEELLDLCKEIRGQRNEAYKHGQRLINEAVKYIGCKRNFKIQARINLEQAIHISKEAISKVLT